MHLHLHVIPRFREDVDDPRGGVRHVIPGKGNYLRGAAENGYAGGSTADLGCDLLRACAETVGGDKEYSNGDLPQRLIDLRVRPHVAVG
jgi:hypothetical protein